ncbi:hypothetical protein NKH18_21955 [Streptomyces sp. M10(2022)]
MVPLQTVAEAIGDYEHARRLYRDGLRMAEDLGLWADASFQLSGLGRIALLTRDYPRAREFHERARRLAAEQSDRFGEQFAEIGLGMGARREGRLDAAERHFDNVLDLQRQMAYEPGVPTLILAELGFLAELRGGTDRRRPPAEGLATARATGDPRALALALEGLAGARLLAGDAGLAARLLGAAASARQSVGTPLPAGERDDVDRVSAKACAVLGTRTTPRSSSGARRSARTCTRIKPPRTEAGTPVPGRAGPRDSRCGCRGSRGVRR